MGKTNIESHPMKKELKKGPWTREEDQKLLSYIEHHGHGSWRSLPPKAGLERCGKSCRLRWTNYLRPDIKRGKFSTHEEKTIIRLHALLGNRWSAIAAHLPKRTDNEIKNYWNTRLKKRLARMGIDPTTHKPKPGNGPNQSRQYSAELSHMAQWETARLEAEARLATVPKLHLLHRFAPSPPSLPRLPCLDVLTAWQASSSGSLDSPTSTLNFSGGSSGAAAGRPIVADEGKGKMEISTMPAVLHDGGYVAFHVEGYNDYGAVDLAAADYNSEEYNVASGGDIFGEFEDVKDYWNELLNLVSSPMVPGL